MASDESFTLPSYVVMAYDATKDCSELEFSFAVNNIRKRGDILRRGNTLVVLGVLHLVSHPRKYFELKDVLCLLKLVHILPLLLLSQGCNVLVFCYS